MVQPTWQTTATSLVQPVEDAVVGSTFVWTGTFKRAGSPAADVPITYAITRGSSVFPGTAVASGTIQTDASGAFRIAETIEGADRYTLVARYEGDDTALGSGASDEFVVTRIPTRVTLDDVDIETLPDQPITISGRITTADGTPLADHPIEIWRYGPMMDPLRTDVDGRFEYQTVPEPPQSMFDNKRTYRVAVAQDSRYAESQALVSVTVAPDRLGWPSKPPLDECCRRRSHPRRTTDHRRWRAAGRPRGRLDAQGLGREHVPTRHRRAGAVQRRHGRQHRLPAVRDGPLRRHALRHPAAGPSNGRALPCPVC